MAPPKRRLRRRILAAISMLVASLAADQLLHRVVLADGSVAGQRVAPFDPPLFSPVQFGFRDRLRDAVAEGRQPVFVLVHDAELGWVPRQGGARRSETIRVPAGDMRRVVAVGCSFTYGEEVEDDETWAEQLEKLRPDLEVVNLGVSAYGAGQSLLRLRRDGLPLEPAEVWLGIVPETLARLESLYRPAHRHWTSVCWFKPRFRIAVDGALELVANPAKSPAETLRLLEDQESFVAAVGRDDRWVQRAPVAYAPSGSRLAHHSGLARLVVTFFEATSRPEAVDLWYDSDDSAARLFLALVDAVARDVAAAGAVLRVVVLPGRGDLQRRSDARTEEGDGLAGELRRRGVEVVDLTPVFLAAGALADTALWMPGGHYAPAGNRLVAESLARRP